MNFKNYKSSQGDHKTYEGVQNFRNMYPRYKEKKTPSVFMKIIISTLLHIISSLILQPRERGRMRFHAIQNVETALRFLRYKEIKLVNIRGEDIVDGNPKLTLGLIWTIILHFHVGNSYTYSVILGRNNLFVVLISTFVQIIRYYLVVSRHLGLGIYFCSVSSKYSQNLCNQNSDLQSWMFNSCKIPLPFFIIIVQLL